MPKQVDHDERRRQIAEAVRRLVAGHGLEAVSLRQVAAEAGVSMGLVQHYFTTKDDMLLFAFHTLGENVEGRIAAAVADIAAAAGQPPGPKPVLRAMLLEMMPLTDASRAEAPVWAAFLARAVVEPRLIDSLRAGAAELAAFVTTHIHNAQRDGATPQFLDPATEATTLLALVDGLMLHLLISQTDERTAIATLDYHLDRIFP